MGCGDLSEEDCDRLRQRLDEALVILGGLQQPDHPDSDEHARQCESDRTEAKRDLIDAASDIMAALGIRYVGDLSA